MKKFIINIFVFGVLFFFLEKSAYLLLKYTAKYQEDNRLQLVIEGDMSKDIIILGTSRGASNVLAKQISEQTNSNAYNLSFPGSDIAFHEFVFNELLKNNEAPKKILYVVDNPHIFIKEESLSFRYDKLFPVAYNNTCNNLLIEEEKHSVLSKYLYSSRLHRINFIFKNKEKSKHSRITSFGSTVYPYYNNDRSWVVSYLDNKKKIDKSVSVDYQEDKLKTFQRIIEKCKLKNIELTFVFAPNYSPQNERFIQFFKTKFGNGNNILVYDKNDDNYYTEECFHDQAHLNVDGAVNFTSEISNYLNTQKN